MSQTDQALFVPIEETGIGGRAWHPNAPPRGFRHDASLGVLVPEGATVQRIHAHPAPGDWVGEARATKTPAGDYLVMFAGGRAHYHGRSEKTNDMLAYRSSDGGRTWVGPTIAWKVPYNQHGYIPFAPRVGTNGTTLYAFGTEPLFEEFDQPENAPIGFRSSHDGG